MTSTDINGSIIVILSEAEARKVYALICLDGIGDEIEQKIVNKIIRALDLK